MTVIYIDEATDRVTQAAIQARDNGRRVFVYEFSEGDRTSRTTLAEAIDNVEELAWRLDHLVTSESRSINGSSTLFLCVFRRT